MIRLGLRLLTWLDQRFPAKVTVTEEGYATLLGMFKDTHQRSVMLEGISDAHQRRIEKLEESLAALKEAMSKPSQAAQAMRAQYIATGRMPE